MILENEKYFLSLSLNDFSQDKLIKGMQKVFMTDETGGTKSVTISGYVLKGYESFGIRLYTKKTWILSIRGLLLSYGSFEHIIDIIMLLIQVFTCWHSETSLIHFLNCHEYQDVIREIVNLRTLDRLGNKVHN